MSDSDVSVDRLQLLLRKGKVEEFNTQRKNLSTIDLKGTDFSGLDLRHLDARGLDLSRCRFRQADLRGIDFSKTRLEGATIDGAKISCTCFPKELAPEEINLSLVHGTCLRYR